MMSHPGKRFPLSVVVLRVPRLGTKKMFLFSPFKTALLLGSGNLDETNGLGTYAICRLMVYVPPQNEAFLLPGEHRGMRLLLSLWDLISFLRPIELTLELRCRVL